MAQTQRIDRLIYTMLVLAGAAAFLSSPGHPARVLEQVVVAVVTASASDEAIAAGALGDVRYLDVPR
jgi:hypothetical protein